MKSDSTRLGGYVRFLTGLAVLLGAVVVPALTAFGQRPPARKAPPAEGERPKYKAIWEPVNYEKPIDLTDVVFVNEEVGWVAGDKGTILHTRDGGKTWEAQLGGDPQDVAGAIDRLYFLDERQGWAMQRSKLLRTTDGQSWEVVGNTPCLPVGRSYVFTSSTNGVCLATFNRINVTQDGGKKWRQVFQGSGVELSQLRFPSANVGYALGGSAMSSTLSVVKTEDGGASWNPVTKEPFGSVHDAFFVDENTGFVKATVGKVSATADGGKTWRGLIVDAPGSLRFADPEVGWSLGANRFVFTTDGGKRWSTRPLPFDPVIEFSLPRRDRAYAVGRKGMIHRYRIVPIDYTVAGMLDAPMMPAAKEAPTGARREPERPPLAERGPAPSTPAAKAGEPPGAEPPPGTPPAGTDEKMITLPNGKTMPWARYEEQFNDLEKKFNALGHSLKDQATGPVVLERPKMDRTALRRQTPLIAAKHLRLNPPNPNFQLEIETLKRRQKGGGSASQGGAAPVAVAQDVIERIAQERWELPMGDPDSFYVNLNGSLTLSGSTAHTKVSGRAAADCSILNQRLQLVQVSAQVDSPKEAEMTASLELRVLGNTFQPLNEKISKELAEKLTLWEKQGEKSDRVDYGYKTRFNVGPVPMSVTVGARGEAGVRWYVGLQLGSATAVVTPFVDTEAYVEVAAVDVEIASAGVGGEMKLVKDELLLKAFAKLAVDPSGKPSITTEYSAQNMMDTLSGKLYLFARAYVCKAGELGPPPKPPSCGEKEFRKELWDWEGFKTNDYLFKKTESYYF